MNRFNNFCHSFVRGAVDFYTLFSACIFTNPASPASVRFTVTSVGNFIWQVWIYFHLFDFYLPSLILRFLFSFRLPPLSTFLKFLFLLSPAVAAVVRIVFCSSALHFDEALRFIISKLCVCVFFRLFRLSRDDWVRARGDAQHQIFERITTTAPIYTIIHVSSSNVSYEHWAYWASACIRTRNEGENLRLGNFYCFCFSILFLCEA